MRRCCWLVSDQKDLDHEGIRKRCLRLGPITEHRLTREGKLICSYFTSVASGYQIAKRRSRVSRNIGDWQQRARASQDRSTRSEI